MWWFVPRRMGRPPRQRPCTHKELKTFGVDDCFSINWHEDMILSHKLIWLCTPFHPLVNHNIPRKEAITFIDVSLVSDALPKKSLFVHCPYSSLEDMIMLIHFPYSRKPLLGSYPSQLSTGDWRGVWAWGDARSMEHCAIIKSWEKIYRYYVSKFYNM